MSVGDDEDASESSEAEEAEGGGANASEGPPAWWKPTPPQEVPPDPVLAEAAEAMRRADVILFLVGEVPPTDTFRALRWLNDMAPVGSSLIVSRKDRWAENGWPVDKITELCPPGAGEDVLGPLQAVILEATLKKVSDVIRVLSANVLCLDIAGAEAADSTRKEVATVLADLPGAVLVTLGAEVSWAGASLAPAVQHFHVPLDLEDSLGWLQRDLSRIEWVSFIVFDTFTVPNLMLHIRDNASEVFMPRDSSMLRIYRKACVEFGAEAFPVILATPPLVAVNILVQNDMQVLEPSSTMPWQFFSPMGDQISMTCMLMVGAEGLRLPGRNARMLVRQGRARAILADMVMKFKSEEYQTRLALVRDQKELRGMIKAVHLSILPKHGFPLTEQSGFAETITMQTRMQTFLYSGQLSPEDDLLGKLSLQLSGMYKLPTLPFRYKEKPWNPSGSPVPPGVAVFKPHGFPYGSMEGHFPLFGGWFGWRRVPAFFMSANADDMADYLRSDPEGPFAGRLDDWPEKGKPLPTDTRWHRWGFVEDAKEAVLKTDWHALPRFEDTAELFVPRRARRDDVTGAPPRFVAFAEAFRAANRGCWERLAEALQSLKSTHERSGSKIWKERGGSNLVDEVIQSFQSHGLFGIIEAQVWWGEGPIVLPSHKDGATSLLHLSLTLGGSRTLRLGLFRSMLAGGGLSQEAQEQWWVKEPDDPEDGKVIEDVWDNRAWQNTMAGGFGVLEDIHMARGSCYISQPYCFEHGVRYETGSRGEPVIALQCRFAFEPDLGKKLNGRRDSAMWEISNAISKTLQAAAERGEVRMPTVEEVKQMKERLASMQKADPAEAPAAAASPGPSPGATAAPAAAPSQAAAPTAAAQQEPEAEAARQAQDWRREKDLLAKKDKAFKEAAKERERIREKARLERVKCDEDDIDAVDACDTEDVQITIRHGQKGGQVVVTVPGCATMLEVKKALVQKIGRGLVRKVQLVKEKGKTFEAYKDQERLCGRRELLMLGLHLAEANTGVG